VKSCQQHIPPTIESHGTDDGPGFGLLNSVCTEGVDRVAPLAQHADYTVCTVEAKSVNDNMHLPLGHGGFIGAVGTSHRGLRNTVSHGASSQDTRTEDERARRDPDSADALSNNHHTHIANSSRI